MAKLLKNVFCMRLHTAGMVVGWLGCLGSLLMIFGLSLSLTFADDIAKKLAHGGWKQVEEAYRIKSGDLTEEEIHSIFMIVCSILLVFDVVSLISSILLIVGTLKNRHSYLLPWLVTAGIAIVCSFVYKLILVFRLAGTSQMHWILLTYALTLALNLYIYRGIYSLYKHLKDIRKQESPINLKNGPGYANSIETYPNYAKL